MLYANISIYLVLLTGLLGGMLIYCNSKIHQKSAYQFRNITPCHGARGLQPRTSEGDEALNALVHSINSLAIRLNKQRIESVESQLLLKTVINHIDVAIIAMNDQDEMV